MLINETRYIPVWNPFVIMKEKLVKMVSVKHQIIVLVKLVGKEPYAKSVYLCQVVFMETAQKLWNVIVWMAGQVLTVTLVSIEANIKTKYRIFRTL